MKNAGENAERDNRAIIMYRNGMEVSDIAGRINLSTAGVYRLLHRYGIYIYDEHRRDRDSTDKKLACAITREMISQMKRDLRPGDIIKIPVKGDGRWEGREEDCEIPAVVTEKSDHVFVTQRGPYAESFAYKDLLTEGGVRWNG